MRATRRLIPNSPHRFLPLETTHDLTTPLAVIDATLGDVFINAIRRHLGTRTKEGTFQHLPLTTLDIPFVVVSSRLDSTLGAFLTAFAALFWCHYRTADLTARTGLQPPAIHWSISSKSHLRSAPILKPNGITPRSAFRITERGDCFVTVATSFASPRRRRCSESAFPKCFIAELSCFVRSHHDCETRVVQQ